MRTLLVVVALVIAAGAARAESWKCLNKGKWLTTKTGNTDQMDWLMSWEKAGTGWKVTGDYNDKYGHAFFEGTCTTTTCSLVQSYKDGKLAGKKYYFTGIHTDKTINATSTENTFKGTWGYAADKLTNGGTWESVATCKKDDGGAKGVPSKPPLESATWANGALAQIPEAGRAVAQQFVDAAVDGDPPTLAMLAAAGVKKGAKVLKGKAVYDLGAATGIKPLVCGSTPDNCKWGEWQVVAKGAKEFWIYSTNDSGYGTFNTAVFTKGKTWAWTAVKPYDTGEP